MNTGNAKLSTTTAREQNRALGRQVYGRYPNPGTHTGKSYLVDTIAFVGSAKILGAAVVVDSSALPGIGQNLDGGHFLNFLTT